MSRRRRTPFALLILRCRECGHKLGESGRDSGSGQSWLRGAPRANIDDEHRRIDFRCDGTVGQATCGATPNVRQDRLDARIDALIADKGPRSTAIVAL